MQKISTLLRYSLLFLIVFAAATAARAEMWPLKREIDLSSGFGDFRQKRFHAGLDIRTGGKIGAELFSPVDGMSGERAHHTRAMARDCMSKEMTGFSTFMAISPSLLMMLPQL